MSVLTEAKIRQYFKESSILENGVFELARGERLTPAARSFLNDHRVKILDANLTREKASVTKQAVAQEPIKTFEDSAVYPLLFRLTRLYPHFLKSQRELHQAFLQDKCDRMGVLLGVLEQLVAKDIREDVSDYHDGLLSLAELEAVASELDLTKQTVKMAYHEPLWRLACYETYLELGLLRQELALASDLVRDSFAVKLCRFLQALEVLVWLVAIE